jgi:hypothetical protein
LGLTEFTGFTLNLFTPLQAELWFHIHAALIKGAECRFFDNAENALILPKDQQLFFTPRAFIFSEDPFLLQRKDHLFRSHILPSNFCIAMAATVIPGD